MNHKLDVFQSMWAMEERRPGEEEKPVAEKVQKIIEAGYDGIDLVSTPDYRGQTEEWLEEIKDTELDISFTALPGDPKIKNADSVEDTLDFAYKWRDRLRYINLVPRVLPVDVNECADMVRGWLALGRGADIPIYVETHRMSMTQDMLFTLELMKAVPEMPMMADLSHCMVNQEWTFPPLSDEQQELVNRILRRSEGFQGRVASAQQIQVQLGFPQHQVWVGIFKDWWRRGFSSWRARHVDNPDARLVYVCELGPAPYAITGADGYELSDRWEEALTLKCWAKDIWNELEANAVTNDRV